MTFTGFVPQGAGAAGPFAGIPKDMLDAVRRLTRDEGEPDLAGTAGLERRVDDRSIGFVSLLRPYRGRIAAIGTMLVAETLLLQSGPLLTQIGIDQGIRAKDRETLVVVAVAIAVTVVLGMFAGGFRVRNCGYIAADVTNGLRLRVFHQLQSLSLDYYTSEPSGVVMTRMTSDIEALQQFLQEGTAQFLLQSLTMVVIVAVLFFYNAVLAAVMLGVVVPVLTALSLWFRGRSAAAFLRVRDELARVIADFQESVSGVRVIAALNRQQHNIRRHRDAVADYRSANDETARVNARYASGAEFTGIASQALLLVVGGWMVAHGSLTLGQLTAFLLYLNAFFLPIQQLVLLFNSYQQSRAAVTKLRGLLGTVPSVADEAAGVELPMVAGRVTFEDVAFAYGAGPVVLAGVDLDIAPGETVAFVGETGAGKSTLAKLVNRTYDATAGRVLVDGRDVRSVSLASLRRQIGVVPQEPFLFVGTLESNLVFGARDAGRDELAGMVDLVGLDLLVSRSPAGLGSPVQERGQSLSAGERQLLALGRAFLAQPRVLILDEATSNLDVESERRLERALDVLLEGRTALLIAHRLSTAMRADRIVVVGEGRILEVGHHSELVAREDGHYRAMFDAWQRETSTGAAQDETEGVA